MKKDSKNFLDAASFLPDRIDALSAWIGHTPFAAWIVGTVIHQLIPRYFTALGARQQELHVPAEMKRSLIECCMRRLLLLAKSHAPRFGAQQLRYADWGQRCSTR